jgi:hypothetical protein
VTSETTVRRSSAEETAMRRRLTEEGCRSIDGGGVHQEGAGVSAAAAFTRREQEPIGW